MQSVETKQSLRQMFGVRSETPFPPTMEPSVSFAGTNPMDVQADMTPAPQYTQDQLRYQRMLLPEMKGERLPGERLKSTVTHLEVLGVSTVADLAESHLVDWLVRGNKLFNQKTDAYLDAKMPEVTEFPDTVTNAPWFKKIGDAQPSVTGGLSFEAMRDAIKDPAQFEYGIKNAVEFMEESGTDSIMAGLANAWVRHMTGVEGAKYVSETSAFIADWFIVWAQVFNHNVLIPKQLTHPEMKAGEKIQKANRGKFNIKLAYEAADFVNPVNIEAALRLTEEMPVVGDGVAWIHRNVDHFLETKFMSKLNWLASKAFLGYHIGKNVKDL